MAVKTSIKADVTSNSILGTFEGECADANITNKNGLDITREVWENVFNSDEYKEAIANRWYIGYLGHPEDPNCMNFQDACITMTEGHIDDNGKIYGKFDLVDTPVGRIVKTFIDSGVTFGISVRGAGDIVGNSVDPDTFVFRGFDIVTFPAYPESIPTFTEIAAATDAESRKKYQKICAAVEDNLDSLNTKESIEVIQSCFAKQSDTYKKLEEKKAEIAETEDINDVDITDTKIEGLTELYVEASQTCKRQEKIIANLKRELKQQRLDQSRKEHSMKRIMSSQLADMDQQLADISHDRAVAIKSSTQLKSQVRSLENTLKAEKGKVVAATSKVESLKSSITASKTIQSEKDAKIRDLESTIKSLQQENLKYKQKIQSSTQVLQDKENNIADLEAKLHETVTAARSIESDSSNRDAEIRTLTSELEIANKTIAEYQDAYANLYASAVGVSLNNVPVTARTSVSELKNAIKATTAIDDTPIEGISSLDSGDPGLVTL